jgi:hypothetical protein
MQPHRTLVAVALFTGACSAAPQQAAHLPPTTAPSASVVPARESPEPRVARDVCPPVDLAAIEARPTPPDLRVIDLAEVFPREEVRAPGAKPTTVELDRATYELHPASGDPGAGIGIGMGFPGLDPAWVRGSLSPPVAAAIDVWSAEIRATSEQERASLLLRRRQDVLAASPPVDDGVTLRCATANRARAQELMQAHEAAARDAAAQAVKLIEALPAPTAAERLALGALLVNRAIRGREDEGSPTFARARQVLSGLVGDANAASELRARAAEQLASCARGATAGEGMVPALQQVIALTRDPELRVDTLIKLADLTPGTPAELEKKLEQIVAELAHAAPDYRLADTQAKLARVRLERGELALARDAATACARATGNDDLGGSDTWGCAPLLADALAELGGATPGAEIPLWFVAPLGLELMSRAIERLDRDEARRAGELVLARLPMTDGAPHILDSLASIAADPKVASALRERRARDHGPGSAWLAAQRARLAPRNDVAHLEQILTSLLAPAALPGTPPPKTPDELRAELQQRVFLVVQGCENELATSGREITLRIDTTGSIPKATATGAGAVVTACLERRIVTRFRSVGPARIRVVLSGS